MPILHVCYQCGRTGIYGVGDMWFCNDHVPPRFLPHLWAPRPNQLSYCARCGAERTDDVVGTRCPGRRKAPADAAA